VRFLNGYKTLAGVIGTVAYAAVVTLAGVDACRERFVGLVGGRGVDVGGGMVIALLLVGLIHKAEKRETKP
jgi:hypothetical protein